MLSSSPIDLAALTSQLDAWRQLHRQRARIPDHFYAAAVALLDRFSVAAICRETRLRPASLRMHATPARIVQTPPAPPSPSFLQLNAADLLPLDASARAPSFAPTDLSSRLLFERADGARLTLHLSSTDPTHLEALCITLLRS